MIIALIKAAGAGLNPQKIQTGQQTKHTDGGATGSSRAGRATTSAKDTNGVARANKAACADGAANAH